MPAAAKLSKHEFGRPVTRLSGHLQQHNAREAAVGFGRRPLCRCPVGPEGGHDKPGKGRASDDGDLVGDVHDGVAWLELVVGHDAREDRARSWEEEGADDAEPRGHDVELPELGAARYHQDRSNHGDFADKPVIRPTDNPKHKAPADGEAEDENINQTTKDLGGPATGTLGPVLRPAGKARSSSFVLASSPDLLGRSRKPLAASPPVSRDPC